MPLQALNTYSNSEESRTFLALSVDNFYIEMVLNLLQKINKVMVDFKLPTFYEVTFCCYFDPYRVENVFAKRNLFCF